MLLKFKITRIYRLFIFSRSTVLFNGSSVKKLTELYDFNLTT